MTPKPAVRCLLDGPRQASITYSYRDGVSLEGQAGRDPFPAEPQRPCPRNLAHS